jgi:hypothetical protein
MAALAGDIPGDDRGRLEVDALRSVCGPICGASLGETREIALGVDREDRDPKRRELLGQDPGGVGFPRSCHPADQAVTGEIGKRKDEGISARILAQGEALGGRGGKGGRHRIEASMHGGIDEGGGCQTGLDAKRRGAEFAVPVLRRSMSLRLFFGLVACLLMASTTRPAVAWGYEGHRVIAAIARPYLTPAVRDKVDALLAADPDTLTGPGMMEKATWADAWRGAGHRETSQWHFVDVELDAPDSTAACFGHPASAAPVSQGPAKACVIDRLDAFARELADPNTAPYERILALKYVLHFAGDLHQPLHASDNHDHGGNCVLVTLGGVRTLNLHSYWDTAVVEALGKNPQLVADNLRAGISPAQKAAWEHGDARSWAQEAFGVAKADAYRLGSPPGCLSDVAPIALPDGYPVAARRAASLQMQRAGVRLALILNRALAGVSLQAVTDAARSGAPLRPPLTASTDCSAQADTQGLHGKPRQAFRRRCKAQWVGPAA